MQVRRFFVLTAMLFALALTLGLSTHRASAASVFTVNTQSDHNDGVCDQTDCTMREAVSAAQAGSGGGTVTFDPNVFPAGSKSKLDGSLGPLQVYSSLSIEARIAGSINGNTTLWDVGVSGERSTRIFELFTDASLNMDHLWVYYGSGASGGAILNGGGTITATSSNFYYNYSTDSGGAIYNDHGTLNLTSGGFSTNSALNGGGIYNSFGTVKLEGVVFYSNAAYTASGNPGGGGGAIYNNGGTLVLGNTAFVTNSSVRGDALYNMGDASLINSTVNSNGGAGSSLGAIYNVSPGTLVVKNSILAANAPHNCSGSGITDGSYNIEDNTSCGFSQDNHSQSGVDPLLTNSFLLQAGSPAIDSGDDSVCAADPVNNVDALGNNRPMGLHCDIGALEADRAVLFVVNQVTNNNGGTSTASDFTMHVTGTNVSVSSFPGEKFPGTAVGVDVGNYTVTQTAPPGYDTQSSPNCSGSVYRGQQVQCWFYNDDIAPVFTFSGFFQPVDNPPMLNVTRAGSVIPVKFRLGGDQGLNIFADGYPLSESTTCASDALKDTIEQTTTAETGTLSYDSTSGTYTYVWKTKKAWAGTCRELNLRLIDGTEHKAEFKLK